MTAVRVKVCGLARREDALWAQERGADYLGVVLTQGFARSVEAVDGVEVLGGTHVERVAVVVDETPERTAAWATLLGAAVVQLHGAEPLEHVRALRGAGPWTLWKSVRARSIDDVVRVVDVYGEAVDGILVEGWKEGVVGGGGATVRVDPAAVRAAIPEGLDFVLAGGLTPEGVAEAVARFRPDVVDVSSGVEAELRRKDPERVRAFVRAVKGAAGPHRAADAGYARRGRGA